MSGPFAYVRIITANAMASPISIANSVILAIAAYTAISTIAHWSWHWPETARGSVA